MSNHFVYHRVVQWSECDPAGIIFFPHYARWLAEAVDLMFLSHGIEAILSPGSEIGCGWPAVKTELRYVKPARLHDSVQHEVEIEHIGSTSMTFAHRILRNNDLLAEAHDVRVWVTYPASDRTRLHATPIPDEIRVWMRPTTHE